NQAESDGAAVTERGARAEGGHRLCAQIAFETLEVVPQFGDRLVARLTLLLKTFGDDVRVAVWVAVLVAVLVAALVGSRVPVLVGVWVGVLVAVLVGGRVPVLVGVGVGVSKPEAVQRFKTSDRCPSPPLSPQQQLGKSSVTME